MNCSSAPAERFSLLTAVKATLALLYFLGALQCLPARIHWPTLSPALPTSGYGISASAPTAPSATVIQGELSWWIAARTAAYAASTSSVSSPSQICSKRQQRWKFGGPTLVAK